MNNMILAKRLKNLREKNGYLQKFVADKLGIRSNTLSGYENGSRSPDPDMLVALSDLYNVTTDYLLGRSEHPRLSEEEFKVADKRVKELWDIIEGMPEEQKEETKQQILAYAKGLADANKKDNKD